MQCTVVHCTTLSSNGLHLTRMCHVIQVSVQYITAQYSTVNTVQYSTVNTVQYSTVFAAFTPDDSSNIQHDSRNIQKSPIKEKLNLLTDANIKRLHDFQGGKTSFLSEISLWIQGRTSLTGSLHPSLWKSYAVGQVADKQTESPQWADSLENKLWPY